ncbi:hypothetical protein [Rhizobium sp. Nf11,1]|uniref:hypothetical protein n=1 Tax=Rhizobium sp. Nf11,1 TaxID=3404923 RepID=UPI003D348192
MNKLRKPPNGFTMVPNALIRSAALSLKAKGLYCLLFAKPDNWVYVEEALIKESADGREAFRSGIMELVRAGWLTKVQVRDEKGVFSHIDWCLSVDGKPVNGSSVDGEAVAGKSPTNNTDDNNTELKKTYTPKAPKGAASGFDEFWAAYPNKVGKPKALAVWNRLKPDFDAVMAGLKCWKASDQWTKDSGRFIPHPTTWLNREGWNDAIAGEQSAASPADLEATQRRIDEAQRRNRERDRLMVEERRRQLGLLT